MMRISTSWMYQQSVTTMLNQESELANTQNQVSTGLRISVPSDDPTGAAQIVSLNHVLAENTGYTNNITAANTRLSTETSTLGTVTNVLNSANDIGLSAINGAMSSADLSNMATQLTQLRDQLVQLANTTDGNGSPLFAGTSTTTTPFTQSSTGAVTYAGNGQQSLTSIGQGLQVANSDPGSSVFVAIPAGNGSFAASAASGNTGTLVVGANSVTDTATWAAANASGPVNDTITFGANGTYAVTDANGNPVNDANGNPITGTYQDGGTIAFNGLSVTMSGTPAAGDTVSVNADTAQNTQDVFTTLNNMITALQGGTANTTALNNTLNRQLEALNQAMTSVSNTQVSVGSRIDTLQQQQSSYADLNVTYQSALSDVQNVDSATAISNLSLQSTALQASQQVFAKVQQLSLFNYIQS
jgi:flagellar hook-associated protein 3 FlgL